MLSLRRPCHTFGLPMLALAFASPLRVAQDDARLGGNQSVRVSSEQPPMVGSAIAEDANRRLLRAEEIAPNLYRIESTAGSNVVALRGSGSSLLVDAGPADGVERLQVTLDSLGFGPVQFLIISHYHDDHLAGAEWFRQRGATVLAYTQTVIEAAKDTVIEEWNSWHREAANPGAMPDSTFVDELTVRLGAFAVRIRHVPAAHTGGDAVVSFDGLGVNHTGDIHEVGAYPFIDRWAGSSVRGMIRAVTELVDADAAGVKYVPGHGAWGGGSDPAEYRDMLVNVCRAVRSRLAAGDDIRTVMESQPTAPYDDTKWGPARHGRALTALISTSLTATGANASCTSSLP